MAPNFLNEENEQNLETKIPEQTNSGPTENLEAQIGQEKAQEKSVDFNEQRELLKTQLSQTPLSQDKEIEAQKEAQRIRAMNQEQDQINHLLALAQKEGLVFAQKAAEAIGDPYLIDAFHDKIISEKILLNELKN